MLIESVQARGIHFLLSHQNDDGGIPAVNLGDRSGMWTTAEVVEAALRSPYLPKEDLPSIRGLVEFLVKSRLPDGGWPITLGGQVSSTMATGHSLVALILAQRSFRPDSYKTLSESLEIAKNEALTWLDRFQHLLGGWGPEPSAPEGKEPRTLSTCYALRGYLASGRSFETSQNFRKSINFLVSTQDPISGGWSSSPTTPPDPASTARVVSILLHSGRCKPDDLIVKRGLKFILADKASWRFSTESYVVGSAPGQVYFHGNTPSEILELLTRCRHTGPELRELLDFFINTQDEADGHWHLRDFEDVDTSISTWSTAEAIMVLDIAYPAYVNRLYRENKPGKTKRWRIAFFAVSTLCCLSLAVNFNIHTQLIAWWSELTEGWKQVIVGSILFAIVASVIANFLSDWLRSLAERARVRLRKWKSRATN